MGLLNSIIGGAVGVEVATLVNSFIEKQGGVQGIVTQFEQKGFGDTVQSWVGTGQNLPISGDQIHQVLGSDTVKQYAEKFGIQPDMLASKLAEIFPAAIDKMTPNGKIAA